MLVDMKKERKSVCFVIWFDVCKISGRKICVFISFLETCSDPELTVFNLMS